MAAAREVVDGCGGAVCLIGGWQGGDAAWNGVVSGGELGGVVQPVGGFKFGERNAQAGFGGEFGGNGKGEGAGTVEVFIGCGCVVGEQRGMRRSEEYTSELQSR